MKRTFLFFTMLWALTTCLYIPDAWAYQTFDAQIPDLYGHLNQLHVPTFGSYACGPTAVTNSFVYLQNAYPGIYSNSLIPSQSNDLNSDGKVDTYDNLISTVQTLGTNDYMYTVAKRTTYHDDLIWSNRKWIEERVPGKTIYRAQDYWNWSNAQRPKPTFVQSTTPTWGFLYTELMRRADVEILLTWSNGGHFVTVNRFYWTDVNGDGMIQQSENAYIGYINPWTGSAGQSRVWHSGSTIYTDYTSGSWISMTASSVPVAEPSSAMVLLFGTISLYGVIRRRHGC